MTLVNRWYQLLKLLVTHKKVSIQEVQKEIKTSNQTIKKDIGELNEEIAGIAKIIQKNKHFELEIYDFDFFDEIMQGKLKTASDFNSASKRIAYLLNRLIETEDFLRMDDLSEEVGVSRGTVVKDLKTLKEMINDFDVKITGTPNKGLRIIGDELELRLLLFYFVSPYFSETKTEQFLEEKQAIKHFQKKTNASKQEITLLTKVIGISLNRISSNYLLKKPINRYSGCFEYIQEFNELINQLEEIYELTLSQYEKDFISFPLNIINTSITMIRKANSDLRLYFDPMMMRIRRLDLIDLDESFLYQEMKQHLSLLINRVIFRYRLTDLFYGEIEKKYPFSYQIASECIQALEAILQHKISKVEISYLTLYLELAFRYQKEHFSSKKVAIVHTTGKGTALMIQRQIKRILGRDIQITHVSEEQYEKVDLNKYFAVFTTIPLKNVNEETPVIHLTNLFDDSWLRAQWQKAKKKRLAGFHSTVFFYQIWKEKKTYQEYLNKLVAPLIRGYYVDEEFEKRILKREYQQSTFVNKEFAFPHTTNQLSQHIVLSVGLITDQGLAETGGNGVIFLFAIPEEMTAEVENELFELCDILFELIKMGIDEFIELAPTQESFLKLIKSKGERLHE
ncbi:HTH domain-containing protein [Enterococcus faecium]|uniref:BglG family transcription antiterminator n=1 Tax=Enterococcus faecium TaxID=1352 RepID=UPI0002A21251|nr:HTH domain-containing protein [Enterococcus faecium]EKY7993721.1 HTH domain-containing protein [Enterococcus faecium]ELA79881.1 lichenan operon transcriptional antiterminator [Enterococcus faecium EnGen0002]ELI7228450.1 HTH domain-containing protein [Enterococcus faecium]KWY59863.1 transcription antiterminator BglG [Enterococcus faecium]KWY72541.1 transcription antiterminator BglG [Enterococcus faecium]